LERLREGGQDVKLSEMLDARRIRLDFKAAGKREAMEALLQPIAGDFDAGALLAALLQREELGSTGVGYGVAVPHVRLDSVDRAVVVFGRSARPVEFDAVDDAPCSLFFLVVGPSRKEAQEEYLQAMAKISRLMRDPAVRGKLMTVTSPADVVETLRQKET
jgi:PTS system nitrogen regulatory IIA component